jgi:hypothetical protein
VGTLRRSVPAINDLLGLTALEELDHIPLVAFRQTEVETGVVVVDHIEERREAAVVEEATLRPRPEAIELWRDQGAADRPGRSTVGLEGVDAKMCWARRPGIDRSLFVLSNDMP